MVHVKTTRSLENLKGVKPDNGGSNELTTQKMAKKCTGMALLNIHKCVEAGEQHCHQ